MNDLTILHLSDLHIEEKSKGSISKVLTNLLDDLKKQIDSLPEKSLVIVVTGDILDKGNISSKGTPKTTLSAQYFFKELHSIVGDKCAGIFIVPGNHDKARNSADTFLVHACREMIKSHTNEFGHDFYRDYWHVFNNSYELSGYYGLVDYVYDLFGMGDVINQEDVRRTYGAYSIKCGNKRTFIFVLLNTAWCCADDDDVRHIVVGDFQLDELCTEVDSLKKDAELIICIGHHPLSMLEGSEETKTLSTIHDNRRIECNAYLCGHLHNHEAENRSNGLLSTEALTILMTGIGSESEIAEDGSRGRYYAIYTYNKGLNSLDITSRGAIGGRRFDMDFGIFPDKVQKDAEKIFYPLSMENLMPYITLTECQKADKNYVYRKTFKAYYPTDEVQARFKNYEKAIERFRKEMCDQLWILKNQLIDEICTLDVEEGTGTKHIHNKEEFRRTLEYREKLKEHLFRSNRSVDNGIDQVFANIGKEDTAFNGGIYDNTEKTISAAGPSDNEEAEKILQDHESDVFDILLSYLAKTCDKLNDYIIGDSIEGSETDGLVHSISRVHFRYLSDFNSLTYSQLCISIPSEVVSVKKSYDMKPLGYEDLIAAADNAECSLIYSVNRHLITRPPNSRWENFITAIPKLYDRYPGGALNRSKRSNNGYPYLTFGISIDNPKLNPLLYYLQSYKIEDTISDIISDFTETIPVNWKHFRDFAKKIIGK